LREDSKSHSEKDEETLIREKTNFPLRNQSKKAVATEDKSSRSGRFITRQFSRVSVNLKTVYLFSDDTNDTKNCELLNMSISGIAFICSQKIMKGTKVRLQLPVLDKTAPDEHFIVSGEIVRVRPVDKLEKQMEYGLHFFHLMKKELDYMELIIQKFSKDRN
jgi:hypothetical protein